MSLLLGDLREPLPELPGTDNELVGEHDGPETPTRRARSRLGSSVPGVVEEVGDEVRGFRPGDRVETTWLDHGRARGPGVSAVHPDREPVRRASPAVVNPRQEEVHG